MIRSHMVAFGVALCLSSPAAAQTANPFGGLQHDRTSPIEITADALEVRQAESIAVFEGDVIAGQGTLRLTAQRVEVFYDAEDSNSETGAIKRLNATGGVFISNGAETAQGQEAEYDVETGKIAMSGDVVLTQGENVISGETLTIDLNVGQGRVEGRVKSIFTPSSGTDK